MNIFNILKGNISGGPETMPFPARKVPAAAYRGPVCIDPAKCLACGICDYVCVSRAITVTPAEGGCEWTYDPGRCTYCGRCADHCPGGAITQQADRGDAYSGSGAQHVAVAVEYPECPECGGPATPFSEDVLSTAFSEVSAELRERVHLCEKCRRRATTAAMKESFGAKSAERSK